MVADISLSNFEPILAFLMIFVLSFVVFIKSNIVGENKAVQLFLAFLIATIFSLFAAAREYVLVVIPWFAVLLIAMFLIFALVGFTGKVDWLTKGAGVVFLIIMVIALLIAAFVVFSPYFSDPDIVKFKNWLYQSKVFGAILLLAVSAVVSWVLINVKK